MADGGTQSFWRTHGALGLIAAVLSLAAAIIPLALTRNDSETKLGPSPTTTTTTAARPERVLLDRGRYHVTASSTLAPDALGNRYDAALAKDGDTRTAWSEGVAGAGVGESLEFSFDSPVFLSSVELVNGYTNSRRLYRRNGRISHVRVVTDRGSRLNVLRDGQTDFQAVELRTGRTDFVRIVIDGVFGGERYEDALISEVRFRVEPRR